MSRSAFLLSHDALRIHHHHLSTHVALAASLALLSAMAFAVATVAQQRAAAEVSDDQARSSGFMGHLMRNPRWWAGTLGNGAGYGLQATALAYGSLLVVQPMLTTSLLFALPLGAHVAHQHLPRSAWLWGLALAVSLAVFVFTGNANNGRNHAPLHAWAIVATIGIPVVVACLVVAHRLSGASRASLLAIAVGLLAGVLAVLTKGVVADLQHGIVHTLTSGEFYALLAVGAAGIYVQQLSFQAGALQASLPIILVLEPLVAAVLGITMLHEQLRVTGPRTAVLVIAVVVMGLSTVALARDEALLDQPQVVI